MNTIQKQVYEFHKACGVPAPNKPQLIPFKRQLLREKLIREEFEELLTAMTADDMVGIADSLGDLLYVIYGTAAEYGINMQPISDEIHRSNMSKLGEDGKAIHRADGKILKGPNFTPPNLAPILEEQSK